MTAKWLRAGFDDDDGYVYKTIDTAPGVGLNEIYMQCDIYVCPFLVTKNGFSGDFMEVFDLYGGGGLTYPASIPDDLEDGESEGPYIATGSGGTVTHWESEWGGQLLGTPTAGLHTIKLHINLSDDVFTYDIDGTVTDFSGDGDFGTDITQLDYVAFGAIFGGNYANFITNIKVGTTDGGTDIIADDFSSGDTSAWEGAFGTYEIVDTPVCDREPARIVFDAQRAFQAA